MKALMGIASGVSIFTAFYDNAPHAGVIIFCSGLVIGILINKGWRGED